MSLTRLEVLTIRLEGIQYDLARMPMGVHRRAEMETRLAVALGLMPEVKSRPIILLGCAFCPGNERGRQWWAQVRGRGVCMACAARIVRSKSVDDARRLIGVRGVHWGVGGESMPEDKPEQARPG